MEDNSYLDKYYNIFGDILEQINNNLVFNKFILLQTFITIIKLIMIMLKIPLILTKQLINVKSKQELELSYVLNRK